MDMHDLEEYFCKELPEYEVIRVHKKALSNKIYMVAARRRDCKELYACWTCWNGRTKSLNHGHYNLNDLRQVEKIFASSCIGYKKPDYKMIFEEGKRVRLVFIDGSEVTGVVRCAGSSCVLIEDESPFEKTDVVIMENLFSVNVLMDGVL